MRLLLDTHTLLWWRMDDDRLPGALDSVITDTRNEILVSIVSLWEIAIKRSLGKLRFDGSLNQFAATLARENGFTLLPLDVQHLTRLERLPNHHRDPFDRLLIAQTLETGAKAATNDPAWKKYRVKTLW